jgi:type III pantothenate kinase
MYLVADIGNTETVLGLMDGEGEVVADWRLSTGIPRTADEFDHLIFALLERKGVDGGEVQRGVLGSVVPSVTDRIRKALQGIVSGPVFTVGPGTSLPITLKVDEPLTVGADRIVNTLAAKELFGRDTIAVDLGTATTFDCITAQGEFLGGVIAPGVQVGMEWLGRRAAKLPRVEFKPPRQVMGKRTEACMESGVFYSTVDAIDGIVGRLREEWGAPDILVVATGGYSGLLAPHCTTVERTEPFLTLKGLHLAGEHMAKATGS